MSITTAIVAGTLVGVRHTLEPDHLAAISTLVGEDGTTRPVMIGTSWGIGHSLPILVVGLLFTFAGMTIPDAVSALFEVLVGALLVYLGARMLVEASDRVGIRAHSHDGHDHRHLAVGSRSVGPFHSHLDGESFLVGIVHGLAGSGVVVVSLVAAAPTVATSLTFLVTFAVISVLSMGTLSLLWGRVLGTGAKRALEVGAGLACVAIGLNLLAAETVGVGVLS